MKTNINIFMLSLMISLPVYSVCENKCPSDKPIQNYNCECVDCNYTGVIFQGAAVSQEVKKCFNREDDGVNSILKECPNNLPLKTSQGCVKCEETDYVYNKKSDCDVCQNRTYKNDMCYLTKCPDSHPFRQYYFNRCLSCENIHCFVHATKDECAKCPNLKYDDEQKGCIEIGTNGKDCDKGTRWAWWIT